jgi:hypothetical protein
MNPDLDLDGRQTQPQPLHAPYYPGVYYYVQEQDIFIDSFGGLYLKPYAKISHVSPTATSGYIPIVLYQNEWHVPITYSKNIRSLLDLTIPLGCLRLIPKNFQISDLDPTMTASVRSLDIYYDSTAQLMWISKFAPTSHTLSGEYNVYLYGEEDGQRRIRFSSGCIEIGVQRMPNDGEAIQIPIENRVTSTLKSKSVLYCW